MKVWDLHCDTLSRIRGAENAGREYTLVKNPGHVHLEDFKKGDYLLQCFACFINMRHPGTNPLKAALEQVDVFYRLMEEFKDDLVQVKTAEDIRRLPADGRVGAMLTLEEGAAFMDDVRIVRDFYRLGVRMSTLTWNCENGLAHPNITPGTGERPWNGTPNMAGLTEKGKEIVQQMEDLHMIVDVSHLSDGGILDLLDMAKRPFAASHSNARILCPHVRNLTDEMIRRMGEKGCLIGLNFCAAFLEDSNGAMHQVSRIEPMIRHAKYLMDLGGEDVLALGSDFDGIEDELEVNGPAGMPKLANAFAAAGFTNSQIEKIFYKNAMRFFEENL